jgi:hypothetical protein
MNFSLISGLSVTGPGSLRQTFFDFGSEKFRESRTNHLDAERQRGRKEMIMWRSADL